MSPPLVLWCVHVEICVRGESAGVSGARVQPSLLGTCASLAVVCNDASSVVRACVRRTVGFNKPVMTVESFDAPLLAPACVGCCTAVPS